jgi:hypothetical protein
MLGNSKAQKTAVADFKPYVVEVENIAHHITSFAKQKKIPTYMIDFDIMEIFTFVKIKDKHGYQQIDAHDLQERRKDEKFFLDSEVDIKQSYKITIKPANFDKVNNIIMELSADKYVTTVIAKIKRESQINLFDTIEEDLKLEIKKKKALNKIIVGLFEEGLSKEIANFLGDVRTDNFKSDKLLEIAKAILPIFPQDGKVVLNYESIPQKNTSNRGFAIGASAGDLLVTFKKPKKGKAGRSSMGRYVPIENKFENLAPNFKEDSDNVDKVENEVQIEYYSKRSGFVYFKDGILDIRNEMDVDIVSLRNTGSIEVGIQTDTKVIIKEGSDLNDSVQDGMNVNAKEVLVSHSIAANTNINADIVGIDGSTHRTSNIFCKKADINTHKGFVKGDEVIIKNLEHGQVVAKVARISNAIGGTIRAEEIYFDVVGSNGTFVASKSINIKKIMGEGNNFIIEYGVNDEDLSKIDEIEANTKKLQKELDVWQKKYKAMLPEYENQKNDVQLIKDIIAKDPAAKKSLSPMNVQRIKIFQKTAQNMSDFAGKIKELKGLIEENNMQLDIYNTAILNSRVSLNSEWKENNYITFKLLQPRIELKYSPKSSERSPNIAVDNIKGEFQVICK